jgi:hypothetical protein
VLTLDAPASNVHVASNSACATEAIATTTNAINSFFISVSFSFWFLI